MAIIYQDGIPGKKCSKCGEWKPVKLFYATVRMRDGYLSQCKACIAEMQKRRYEAKRDEIIRRVLEHQKKNAEKRREYFREYQKKNAKSLLKYVQGRRMMNLDEERRKGREKYHKNENYRKYLRAYQRKWRKNNPDKVKAIAHRRRAKRIGAGESFSAEEWEQLKKYYKYTCLCCRRQEPEIKLTPDHVIPLGEPGTGRISNIQPLCLSCNSSKGARVIDYRPRWSSEGD